MGRIGWWGQGHEPVMMSNLVAGETREGRVMLTLLEKMERIRREMGIDKVFDVVGRLFEGVSLAQYMESATTEEGARQAEGTIVGRLTKEQVEAQRARERLLYGDGGDVKRELPRLKRDIEEETYRRLMPGYVIHFIEKAAPLLQIGVTGDLDAQFTLRPLVPGALDAVWPALDRYTPEQCEALTAYRPADKDRAIFLHPGEPAFEALRGLPLARF